ncbi:DUF4352 domain-containing protein [Streptomyces sp. NPDC101149]|uniref:DUF4352 domain-containing protein n=1 Tax=Streptomyces sp. NPDC101149 TaxID=3366113 RepID=UPI003812CA07
MLEPSELQVRGLFDWRAEYMQEVVDMAAGSLPRSAAWPGEVGSRRVCVDGTVLGTTYGLHALRVFIVRAGIEARTQGDPVAAPAPQVGGGPEECEVGSQRLQPLLELPRPLGVNRLSLGGTRTMNARTRLAATTAVLAVSALALTACETGTTVNDKPKAHASVPANSGKKAAAKEEKKPDVAKVGDTIGVTGMDGGKLDVTVVKVVDNAKPGDEFTEPSAGKRFYGVQFQLVNAGKKAYSDSPSNGAQISDAQGQQFQATIADITAGPSMSSDVRLKPGAKALGWIVFEVPKGVKPSAVQFTMDSGFSDDTGEWKLN